MPHTDTQTHSTTFTTLKIGRRRNRSLLICANSIHNVPDQVSLSSSCQCTATVGSIECTLFSENCQTAQQKCSKAFDASIIGYFGYSQYFDKQFFFFFSPVK